MNLDGWRIMDVLHWGLQIPIKVSIILQCASMQDFLDGRFLPWPLMLLKPRAFSAPCKCSENRSLPAATLLYGR